MTSATSNKGSHRFSEVSCSQCGNSFGAGNAGFSNCTDHARLTMAQREAVLRQWNLESLNEPELLWLEVNFEDMADMVNKARFCAGADADMTPDDGWMARQDRAYEDRSAA